MPNNLEASIDIAASPEKVWSILADLNRMSEFSPTTVKMLAIGGVREGARTINLNRDGWKVWPTSSRIVRFVPNTALAFRMNENHTVWSYELAPTAAGTRLVERRTLDPKGIPGWMGPVIKLAGGEQKFEADLVSGMHETLRKIKAAAER
ncbi:SRPBCC family protein [Nocardia sp. NPDC050378]|uniref:SRPBCC family protein n=1 Tax=Nocardia sp. NPDC050378 TaxID=3155400 RepID=UPI0033EE1BB6